jgi:hypothetical protein
VELFETPGCPICSASGMSCQTVGAPARLFHEEARIVSEYKSTKRVYEKDDEGVLRLKYAEGDSVPEAEARRQGLVKAKAKPQPPEDKSPRRRARAK